MKLPRVLIAAGGIYTAQSLIGGLTFMGVPAVMRAEGVSLEKIGLVSLAMLVWVVKFLWAPPVERFRRPSDGRRRSRQIIIAGELLTAFLLVALGLSGLGNFSMIIVMLIALAVVAATVDIACDAFIIEQLPADKRGLGNIAQVGGGYLGLIFGSGLFVAATYYGNWMVACLLMSLLLLFMSLPMMLASEPSGQPMPEPSRPSIWPALARSEIQLGLIMTLLFEMGGRLAQSMSGPLLVDAGMPLSMIGILNGGGGVAAGLVGTLAGGFAVQKLGARNAVILVASAHVVTLGLLAATVLGGVSQLGLLAAVIVLESCMMAAGFVVLYSRLMALTSPSQPGIDFTLFQCASAAAATVFGMSGALLAARAGYGASFGIAAFLSAVAVAAVAVIERRLSKGARE